MSEHVCIPERRLSTSSTASRMTRRRSSVTYPTGLVVVSSPPLATLEPVRSGGSDDDLTVLTASSPPPGTAPLAVAYPTDKSDLPRVSTTTSATCITVGGLSKEALSLSHAEAGGMVQKHPQPFTWSRWAGESVATQALVPALITQALATGILDATTYADFSTFASNQTGNAILLTLSAVGTIEVRLLLTGVSFAGFLGCAFLFGHIGHWVGVRRRAWLLCSTFFQTMCLVISAILVSPAGPRATALGGQHEWVILFLFAAMSGSQVAMARQSSCQELPTAPMTSTFVDFVADQYLFAAWGDPKATPRNRRIAYVISMIGGSFIGACLHRYSSSWVVVVVTVVIKLGAMSLLLFARPDEPEFAE